ncbi:MAG: hypothetical protein ACSHX6_15105 [Akkermansiaceae bacterium]
MRFHILVFLAFTICVSDAASDAPIQKENSLFSLRGEQFTSSAVVHVLAKDLEDGVGLEEVKKYFEKQVSQIGSDLSLKKACRELNFIAPPIKALQKKIRIKQREGTDLIEISVVLPDRRQSRDLAQKLAELYIEERGEKGAKLLGAAKLGVPFKPLKEPN